MSKYFKIVSSVISFFIFCSSYGQTWSHSLARVGDRVITSRSVTISGVLSQWEVVKDSLSKESESNGALSPPHKSPEPPPPSGGNANKTQGHLNKHTANNSSTSGHVGNTGIAGNTIDKSSWLIQPQNEELFNKQFREVIMEELAFQEAQNFEIGKNDDSVLQKEVEFFQKQMKGWKQWEALEVSMTELFSQMKRKKVARSFLKFKINSVGVEITDEEALDYFNKNRSKFGNYPFESFKENIKSQLAQQKLEEKLKGWFDVLKRKFKLQILTPTQKSRSMNIKPIHSAQTTPG